jgi:hypothetical protein
MSVRGTRPRNPISSEDENNSPKNIDPPSLPPQQEPTQSVAPKMSRRSWFSALVPALGEGLVQLLRESNHFEQNVRETLLNKTRELAETNDEENSR